MNYDDAKAECESRGLNLVEIGGDGENNALIDYLETQPDLPKQHIWLGITDNATEGVWASESSGNIITYTRWTPDDPTGGTDRNCAIIVKLDESNGGKWNDVTCDGERNVICEKGICYNFTSPPSRLSIKH